MKTAEEFRSDVYEKKGAAVAARRRKNRRATLCVSMALIVTLCGVGVPRLLRGDADLRPRLLQVGTAKNPVDLQDDQAIEEELEKQLGGRLPENAQELAKAKEKLLEKTASDTAIDPSFSDHINEFSMYVSSKFQKDGAVNDCISPVSLYYNFALLEAGANGDTAEDLLGLLGMTGDTMATQCRNYYAQHYHDNQGSAFRLENSLWLDSAHTYHDAFIQKAEECFYSSLFRVDFEDPTVADDMTKWVSDNTDGLVNPQFELSKDHQASIMTTLCYKNRWDEEKMEGVFDPTITVEDSFTKADGSTCTAEYMRKTMTGEVHRVSLGAGHTLTWSSLPLGNGDELVAALPDEGFSFSSDFSNKQNLFEFICSDENEAVETTVSEINWRIPRFSLEKEYDCADLLPDSARDEVLADFRNMGKVELFVYKLQHNTSFSLDEAGINATASFCGVPSSYTPAENAVEMNLNRPFIFAVLSRDRTTSPDTAKKSVVYCGVCGDPTQN